MLKVPDEDDKVIIMMPMLRHWDTPSFETVGEVVDFFGQLFEVRLSLSFLLKCPDLVGSQGLQFMHMHHVAHRYALLPHLAHLPTIIAVTYRS
jgi:hypothetical protein